MHKPFATLLSFALIGCSVLCSGQSNGVPAGILARVIYLKNGEMTGTGFLIDYKEKEYLITARHVVEGLPSKNAKLQEYRSADWRYLSADVILPNNKNVDIAVLDIHQKPSLTWNPNLGDGTPMIGGQVYFLGFPYGLHTLYNNGEYMPLVKVGIFSGIDNSDPEEELYYIDGFNNPGFSGGPVVYIDNTKRDWHIFAVIQGYRPESVKTKIKGKPVDTGLLVNSGILLAYPLDYALKAIDAEQEK